LRYLIYNNTYTSITNVGNIGKGQNVDASAISSGESVGAGVSASTRYLEKGDYLKLRNATISYSIGDVGSYVKGLNVFLTGSNLFVITKFTGFDPEVNIDKAANNYPSRSIEFAPYPTPRIITFGVNCAF
jgi:iron complex outermembrane receptor protein